MKKLLTLLLIAFAPLLANAQKGLKITPPSTGLHSCQQCDPIGSGQCGSTFGAGACICILAGDGCDTWGSCSGEKGCISGEKEARAYLEKRLNEDPDIRISVAGNCAGGIKAVRKLQAEYKAKGKRLNAKLPDDPAPVKGQ